jgi:carboxymethylenebutenolidase
VVVLQELFGVNADIRATCDELKVQGFIAIAPDLFWRQEPGVDLNVRSEDDWQHGLRLYAAYDRDAGARDIMETVRTVVELPESTGKVALQGYCLGALMAFITAARYELDAAVAYRGSDTEKYLGEVGGLEAPFTQAGMGAEPPDGNGRKRTDYFFIARQRKRTCTLASPMSHSDPKRTSTT